IVIHGAMESRASALRGRIDLDRTRSMLRGIVAGLDSHFLDHVRVGSDDASVIRAEVHHAGAVNRHVVLFAAETIDVILASGVGAAKKANLLERRLVWSDN